MEGHRQLCLLKGTTAMSRISGYLPFSDNTVSAAIRSNPMAMPEKKQVMPDLHASDTDSTSRALIHSAFLWE